MKAAASALNSGVHLHFHALAAQIRNDGHLLQVLQIGAHVQLLQLGHFWEFFRWVAGRCYVGWNSSGSPFPVFIARIPQSAGWAATTTTVILAEMYR